MPPRKEAGTVGETNFSSKIMCSVQFLLCTWMTLIPDEPSALEFAGNSQTMTLTLKKIRVFQVYLWRTIQNQKSNVVDFSWRPGSGSEGKDMKTLYCIWQVPLAHVHAMLPHLDSDSGWMKRIPGARGHHLIIKEKHLLLRNHLDSTGQHGTLEFLGFVLFCFLTSLQTRHINLTMTTIPPD